MEDKAFIKQHFQGEFESALLEEISDCPLVRCEAGTELRHEAQSLVRSTPIVISGAIRVTRIDESGKEILLYFIRNNESCFLSIAASLDNNFSHVDSLRAVVYEPTVMLVINDIQIRKWNDQYRSWRDFVAKINNRRFGEFFGIIDNVVFKNVDEKLMNKLEELSAASSIIEITHQELAVQIGTAREVVSRLLKTLERERKVELSRGRIKILSLV